jgi:uncharacterized membrane protein YeiB
MKKRQKFFTILAIPVLLLASLAMAQQATPESSPPMQMQNPTVTSPSAEQSNQQMQKMDRMADSVTKMSEMCQMMMKNEKAAMPFIISASVLFGLLLFVALVLLIVLEIQWIKYWSRILKSEKAKET